MLPKDMTIPLVSKSQRLKRKKVRALRKNVKCRHTYKNPIVNNIEAAICSLLMTFPSQILAETHSKILKRASSTICKSCKRLEPKTNIALSPILSPRIAKRISVL